MFSSSVLCLLAGFSQYFLVSASPTTLLDRVEPRQVKPRCNNGIPFDPACWTILKIPEYYQNWTETHGQNCSDLGYGDFFDYNVPGCFTALVTGKSYPCNTTGTSDSDELGLCAIDPLSLQNYSPQDAYVLHGIYGVWKWFQSISKQIRNAPPALSKGAQIIADQFDPPSEPLQFSPEFIWLSLAAGVLDTRLPASNSTFFQAFEERARTDPAFGDLRTTVIAFQNVTVTGYLGSMIPYEWDPKTAFNGSIVLDYGTILDQGLQSLMTDPYRFLAVTINGSFIDDIE
ncbi:MAG: hypothetical protein M1812_002041 [Candelaria pacifica]|nr:MAG: hypothetical protein M1812_002041 [Candelaria pacifica]